jgi:hypothetical protein
MDDCLMILLCFVLASAFTMGWSLLKMSLRGVCVRVCLILFHIETSTMRSPRSTDVWCATEKNTSMLFSNLNSPEMS